MKPEEKAAKRAAVIDGMVARGYTRERAEQVIGDITKTLFGPGGRFASDRPTPPARPHVVCPHDPPCRRLESGWPACGEPSTSPGATS